MFPKLPGVYCFKNSINNKVYIGSAQCLSARINNHINNRNSNPHLQNAIKKHGLKVFNIAYVTTKTHAEALMQEQLILDYLFQNDVPKYNLSLSATGGKTLADYSNHAKISEKGGGSNSKVRFALEVKDPSSIYSFKSSYEAAEFTKVPRSKIPYSCKNAKPENSESGRWLFSDVSIDDLKTRFNNLTRAEIKGSNNTRDKDRGFILINKITGEQSQVFYSVYEPQRQGYKIFGSNLSQCLLGNGRTINGHYVSLCI